MYPMLVSIGGFHIYVVSIALTLAWLVFSFLFWRHLRSNGIDEDKIFDITFWATLYGGIASRIVYVALHWEQFSDTWLRIIALWVAPGFSLYGAIIGVLIAFLFLSKREKVRLGHLLDAFAYSFPVSLSIALSGLLFDGGVVGTVSSLPWAIRYIGKIGTRHPVQIYEIVVLICIAFAVSVLFQKSRKKRWPYGAVGVWFFLLYSIPMFMLEFLKDTRVYFISLRANQWILIALFAEGLGAFYVRCGGREFVRPRLNAIQIKVHRIVGGIYDKISTRRSR